MPRHQVPDNVDVSSPDPADPGGSEVDSADAARDRADAARDGAAGPPPWRGHSANVADLLRTAAARHPDRPALVEAGRTRTWAELERAADAGAWRLNALGAAPGERIVISLPTGADLALALFAAARAGLIAVPTAPGVDVAELADRVQAIASICTERDHRLGIALGAGDVAGWWTASASPFESIGGGEDLVLLARARGDRAVMLSHRAIGAAVDAIGRLGDIRVRDGDRILQVLPLYHVAGWVVSFLPTTLVGGATVIPEVGFDVATVAVGVPGGSGSPAGRRGRSATESALRAAAEHSVSVVPGAPGFFHHLLAVPDAERSLTSVRLFTSGNAPLSAADFAAFQDRFGQPVWEGYGLSESASVVTTSLITQAPVRGSVGRPLAGVDLRVIGPDGQDQVTAAGDPEPGPGPAEEPVTDDSDHDPLDTVADVPDAGEVGRIAIRGATLFSGYWPNGGGGPAADGWFVTGDVGFLDDSGALHLVDRAAETIVVSGFTVYPREVEDVLAGHPDVTEAAVIGVPATDGHEELVAVLVGSDGSPPADDDLREWAAERLPAFKRPAVYRVVDDLPRTEVGRIDRDETRRRFGPAARQALHTLVAVPDSDHGGGSGDADADAGAGADDQPAPDVAPEPAGDLADLGAKLPGTGDRAERARDDTDDDLF